jgi:hypothetical protein
MAALNLRIAACPALEIGLILSIAYTPGVINCSAAPPHRLGRLAVRPALRPGHGGGWRKNARRCRAGAVVHGQGRKGLEVA